MKISAILRTLLILVLPLSASAENQYDILLKLDPAARVLHATAVVRFRAPQDGDSIRFLLADGA